MKLLRKLAFVSTWRCPYCGQWFGPRDSDHRPVCNDCERSTPTAA